MSRLTAQARFLIGLAACALLLYTIYNFMYLPPRRILPDEHRFIESAVELAETGEFRVRGKRAWEMPGMALLSAALYKVAGSKNGLILFARALQSVLLIITAVLVYRVAMYLFRDRLAATISYGITLFYPFFVFYQGVLTSETVFIVLLVTGMLWLYKWEHAGFRIDHNLFLAMVAFALAVYIKATLSILPPLLAGAFALLAGRSPGRAGRALVFSSLVYGLCLSPWWFRNYRVLDDFVPFTTSSARVLYSGNNPMNRSGGGLRGRDWVPIEAYDTLPELEWAKAYQREAVAYIKEKPGVFLALAVTRFGRFWRLYAYAEEWRRPIYIVVSVLSFGTILLFALVGSIRTRKMWRRIVPIYLLIGFFTLVHVVSISSIRYRLPLEPFLIALAALPMAPAWRLRAQKYKRVGD